MEGTNSQCSSEPALPVGLEGGDGSEIEKHYGYIDPDEAISPPFCMISGVVMSIAMILAVFYMVDWETNPQLPNPELMRLELTVTLSPVVLGYIILIWAVSDSRPWFIRLPLPLIATGLMVLLILIQSWLSRPDNIVWWMIFIINLAVFITATRWLCLKGACLRK